MNFSQINRILTGFRRQLDDPFVLVGVFLVLLILVVIGGLYLNDLLKRKRRHRRRHRFQKAMERAKRKEQAAGAREDSR